MNENTFNIILANAPVKNGNRGCVALSITMMSLIAEVMKNAGLKCKLFLPDSEFRDSKRHEYKIQDELIAFEDCPYPKGLNFKENIKIALKSLIKRENKAKQIFENADFIF